MVLFMILGAIVLIAFTVLGLLFYLLDKEAKRAEEEKQAVLVKSLAAEQKASQPSAEKELYKKRVSELELELKTISQKAEGQSGEAKQMIQELTRENQALQAQKTQLAEAEQKLTGYEAETSVLKTENVALQTQLEGTQGRMRLLEEEMTAVKMQMGEEIQRSKATIAQLEQEKQSFLSAPKPMADEGLHQELEALKAEHLQLKQQYEKLEKEHQALAYEMIKARAQSSGLERVSFNYKNQLEDFLKKVTAAQAANEHLSQAKNRLEHIVEEVRLQNEDLAKKDQLFQFELEKNRSRVANLERECEGLKAQVHQKD